MNMDVDTKGMPLWKYLLLEHGVSIVSGGDGTDPSGAQQQQFAAGQHDAPTGGGVTVVEPPAAPDPNAQGGGAQGDWMNDPRVQEAINRARTEERDKLYPQLEELKGNVHSLTSQLSDRERARQEAEEAERAAAEAAARTAAEEEMSARELLETRDREWNERFTQMQDQMARQNAVIEKERQLNALTEYRTARIDEVRDQVHPEFLDYVRGNTPEEIDIALQTAIEKSQAIAADTRQIMQEMQMRTPMSSVTTTPGPEAAIAGQRTLTDQEIRAMPMDQYERYRPQLLRAASQGFYGQR